MAAIGAGAGFVKTQRFDRGTRSGRSRAGQRDVLKLHKRPEVGNTNKNSPDVPHRVKNKGQDCLTIRNLHNLQRKYAKTADLIRSLTVLIQVHKKRFSKPVVYWLIEEAKTTREAKELLEFLEAKNP